MIFDYTEKIVDCVSNTVLVWLYKKCTAIEKKKENVGFGYTELQSSDEFYVV